MYLIMNKTYHSNSCYVFVLIRQQTEQYKPQSFMLFSFKSLGQMFFIPFPWKHENTCLHIYVNFNCAPHLHILLGEKHK